MKSIENNYSGAYFSYEDPGRRQIQIRRSDVQYTVAHGFDHPLWTGDARVLMTEICVIAHEIAHAEHHAEGSARFFDYKLSLNRWVDHDENGGLFTEWDRGRIYEEESLAETRGREIVQMIAPWIIAFCDERIYDNLNSYHSILWSGKYPTGGVHKWNRKLYLNPLASGK